MSPYIIFKDEGDTYCLQRDYPNYIAVLQTVPQGVIPKRLIGHVLYLNFRGVLSGNRMTNDVKGAGIAMENMAFWFWRQEILGNPEYYNKFKE